MEQVHSLAFAILQKNYNTESPFFLGYFVGRHLMARWVVMTGHYKFSMALGAEAPWFVQPVARQYEFGSKKKKKKRDVAIRLFCEVVVHCNDVCRCWVEVPPAWARPALRGHAVQGCPDIPVWLSVLEGTEKAHWKPWRKAVLGGRIKTTDVTFDVLGWLENLMGLGSFLCLLLCNILFREKGVNYISSSFFFFLKCLK